MNLNEATFTPIEGGDATFELVDEATFDLVGPPETPTLEEQERRVQEMLEREGIASAEAAFLSGEIKYVISSNVRSIQYLWINPDGSRLEQLFVGFVDGSLYQYLDVPFEVARDMYHASSYGTAVWDLLRVRGTVYGHQFDYAIVSGNRVWHNAGDDSIARHESLPRAGEPFDNYHPALNWRGAKGMAGNPNAGVNLGKRGGSRKVAAFTPVKAAVGHIKPAGPFA